MKSLDETKLLPGDIIVSTSDAFVSKVIRTGTKSDISHAMVYVARCSVIDSTSEGVHARNTQRMFFDDDCAVRVLRLGAGLTSEQRQRVIEYARGRIGTRYSIPEAVRSAIGTKKRPSRRQFCSRLVAQAYAWAGVQLVNSPEYCIPDEIKNSALLVTVNDVLVPVSDEHVERVERDFDTNDIMREGTNRLLNLARTKIPAIEGLHDIDEYLVANPADDARFARFYEESGYLTAWEVEFNKNRWQYELPLLIAMPGTREAKRNYCIGVLEDHGDMLVRRDGNRAGYTILHGEYGFQTFAKLKTLYEKLVNLLFARRAVALQWLERFAPEALPEHGNSGSSTPHTEEWFAVLERQNPQQANLIRTSIAVAGGSDVCSLCGDSPAQDYRLAGVTAQPDTILTLKLCDDCRQIRKTMYDETFSLL